jgi:hypothetical protein
MKGWPLSDLTSWPQLELKIIYISDSASWTTPVFWTMRGWPRSGLTSWTQLELKFIYFRLCQLNYTHILNYERLASQWPHFLASAWIKFFLYFRLCQLNYTHILNYERLASEWPHFLASASLPPDLELPWENKGAPGSLKKYFANISR